MIYHLTRNNIPRKFAKILSHQSCYVPYTSHTCLEKNICNVYLHTILYYIPVIIIYQQQYILYIENVIFSLENKTSVYGLA